MTKKISFFDTYSKQEVEDLFEQTYQDLVSGITPNRKEKKAIFLDGLPGSGKSSLSRAYQKEHPEFVYLSIDDLMGKSPDFEPVTPQLNDKYIDDKYANFDDLIDFAAFASRHIIQRTKEDGHSIIIDGICGQTMRTNNVEFSRAGYDTKSIILTMPKRMLDLNVLSRFILSKTDYKPKTLIMSNLRRPKKSINAIVDNAKCFELWGSKLEITNPFNNTCLYSTEHHKDMKKPEQIFTHELTRRLNPAEQEEMKIRQDYLSKKVRAMNCAESQKRFYLYAIRGCDTPYMNHNLTQNI